MGKSGLSLMYVMRRFFLFGSIALVISGCKNMASIAQPTPLHAIPPTEQQALLQEKMAALAAQEQALITREQAISARETELVDLLAELTQQKKALEASQTKLQKKRSTTVKRTRRKVTKSSQNEKVNQDQPLILGALENVHLTPPGIIFSARIDTGATTSSLNAQDLVELERDGKPYVKFHVINPVNGEKVELIERITGYVRIKEHKGKSKKRPIIKIRVQLAHLDEKIEFTLVDRSRFKQQVLLGRNFLRDLAIVDVSKKYSVSTTRVDSDKTN